MNNLFHSTKVFILNLQFAFKINWKNGRDFWFTANNALPQAGVAPDGLYKKGADYVTVLAVADDGTIQEYVKAARKNGKVVVAEREHKL